MEMILAIHVRPSHLECVDAPRHSLVIVSSRFNNVRATHVQAASSVGVEPSGTVGVAVLTSRFFCAGVFSFEWPTSALTSLIFLGAPDSVLPLAALSVRSKSGA